MIKLILPLLLAPALLYGNPKDSLFAGLRGFAPVFLTAGYRMPLANRTVINSGHGIYTEAGFNPGTFLNGNTILGIYAGWGWKDNLWGTAFNGNFVRSYKHDIDHDLPSSHIDSSIIAASAALFESKKGSSPIIPGCEMRSFHNYALYYGLIVKLPFAASPVLKIYRGSTRSHYQGPSGLVTSDADYNSFQLRRSMYGCELSMLNPLGLFRRQKPLAKSFKKLGIGLYYEYADLRNSALHFNDGNTQRLIPLKRFLSSAFFDTWRSEHSFGCKLSYTFI